MSDRGTFDVMGDVDGSVDLVHRPCGQTVEHIGVMGERTLLALIDLADEHQCPAEGQA